MILLFLTTLFLLSESAIARPFDFLLFSPESKQPFPYSESKESDTESAAETEEKPNPPLKLKLKRAPVDFLSIHKGTPLVLDLGEQADGFKISWILNGRSICESKSCAINSYKWKPGEYKLILQISEGHKIIEYWTRLLITKPDDKFKEELYSIPLIEDRPTDFTNSSEDFLGQSIKGIAYIEKARRDVSVKLGRKFSFKANGTIINTSTKSVSKFVQGDQLIIDAIDRSSLRFNPNSTFLKYGLYRIRKLNSGEKTRFQTMKNVKIEVGKEGDIFVQADRRRTVVSMVHGRASIELNKTLLTSLAPFHQILLREQLISEGEKSNIYAINPNQKFIISKDKLIISNNGTSKLAKSYRLISPLWLEKEINENQSNPEKSFNKAIESGLSSKNELTRADSYLQAGLIGRSQFFYYKQLKTAEKDKAIQRISEGLLLKKRWSKLARFKEKHDEKIPDNHIFQFYYGIALFHLGDLQRSEQQLLYCKGFISKPNILASIEEHLRYIDLLKDNRLEIDILTTNNNNVLRAPQDSDLPNDIIHRSSLGFEFKIGNRYRLFQENLIHVDLLTHLDFEQWVKEGLSEYSYLDADIGLKARINEEGFGLTIRPYIAKTQIGSYPGLDTFGILTTISLPNMKFEPEIHYDHSKNLDTDANDESSIDPILRHWSSNKDRSRQVQNLAVRLNLNPSMSMDIIAERSDYRGELSNGEDGLGFGLGLRYEKAWSYALRSQGQAKIMNRSYEDGSDQFIQIEARTHYLWDLRYRLGGFIRLLQNSSSIEEQAYQQNSFGLSTAVSL